MGDARADLRDLEDRFGSIVLVVRGRPATNRPALAPHSFITAALDVGAPLLHVREAASQADLRTTMRYDRGRRSLDRHATDIVATFFAVDSR